MDSPIYVSSAQLHGRFGGRPEVPLRQMMIDAARRALEAASLHADDVDALFAGAMGNFQPEGFVGPIPIRLANALGLRNADLTPMLVGSSEAGAWVLRQAYDTIKRAEPYEHVLVVAGEQMNAMAEPVDETAAAAERLARNRAISEILDERERRYGLNMVRVGDLIMDILRDLDGWLEPDLANRLLPLVALSKYERVSQYPMGHLHGKVSTELAAYHARPPLARYFNLHDVTPTSSGAVALVLARHPGPRSLRILGMGQSVVSLSLADRSGDLRVAPAIRRAVARACREGGVGLEWLHDCDFALVHDAFPSIEYFFLKELGWSAREIAERATSGWSNPFGGLKTCGHALGASGLLQVAKAYHRIFRDPDYLTRHAFEGLPEVNRCFATSVGGALTNVVVSLLERADLAGERRPRGDIRKLEAGIVNSSAKYDVMRSALPPGQAVVLGTTRIRHQTDFGDDDRPLFRQHTDPYVCLVELSPSGASVSPKALAYAHDGLAIGQLVTLTEERIDGVDYLRAEPTRQRVALPETGRAPVDDALRAWLDGQLSRFA